jgi:ribosome-binding factor A
MPKDFSRTQRVGEQIRRELAELIRNETDAPAMAMVSITDVDVTRDFAYAKVYVTLLGEPGAREQVINKLNKMAPAFRRELGRHLRMRSIPSLTFIYDETVEHGARLSELITKTVAADAARHQEDSSQEETG